MVDVNAAHPERKRPCVPAERLLSAQLSNLSEPRPLTCKWGHLKIQLPDTFGISLT